MNADVGDPTRLAVGARDGLDGAATHEQQAKMAGAVDGLASAEIERERALFRLAVDAIDRLQIVELGVKLECGR